MCNMLSGQYKLYNFPFSTFYDFIMRYLCFHAAGEGGSMSVDSQLCHVLLSKLTAGATYDITVRSLLETLESEPITASVTTGLRKTRTFCVCV